MPKVPKVLKKGLFETKKAERLLHKDNTTASNREVFIVKLLY